MSIPCRTSLKSGIIDHRDRLESDAVFSKYQPEHQMLLTSLFIVSGVSYLGGRVYRGFVGHGEDKILAAEIDPDGAVSTDLEQSSQHQSASGGQGSEMNLVVDAAPSFEDSDIGTIEEWIGREWVVSNVTLGFALAGTFFYPPMLLVSAGGLVYLSVDIWKRAIASVMEKRRIDSIFVEAVFLVGLVITGEVLITAASFWLVYLALTVIAKAKRYNLEQLTHVFSQQPTSAWVVREGVEVSVSVEQLNAGDIVVVQAGEVIPVDGEVIQGMAEIDQRMLTGESQPAEKGEGETVFSTTLVLSGHLHIRVEKAGSETMAAGISQVLSETSDFAASVELRCIQTADKWALPHLVLSALAYPIAGMPGALAVLWSPFDDAMFMGGPLGVLSYLSIASSQGLLVKDGRALDMLQDVDIIVFDKTGTLTLEQPHVGQIHRCGDYESEDILRIAAAAEYKQTHPIALAIIKEAKDVGVSIPGIQNAEYEVGYGIQVQIDIESNGEPATVKVGSANFMAREGVVIPDEMEEIRARAYGNGYSLVFVSIDGQLVGAIQLHATVRDEAKAVIEELKRRHYEVSIISGDQLQPTAALAQELGVEHFFAEVLPEQKAELIEKLQDEGKSVCFVGDGINDAIALKKANVSISLSGASTVAIDTAQVVLMRKNLGQIIELIDLADEMSHNMKRTILAGVIPSVAIVGGVFFFKMSMYKAAVLYTVGVMASTANAIAPLLKYKMSNEKGDKEEPYNPALERATDSFADNSPEPTDQN